MAHPEFEPEQLTFMYRHMAAQGSNFLGLSIVVHKQIIEDLIRSIHAKTILDYGSGRGDAYYPPFDLHRIWGVEQPTLYDPAFPAIDQLPPEGVKFDLVICNDVLEHVSKKSVAELIDHLFLYAKRAVWASVCCRPAKKFFPDGTNLHITVKPLAWWLNHFEQASERYPGVKYYLIETP